MNLHYISPSLLPSRAANAIHVIQQCYALSRLGVDVTLYAKRTIVDEAAFVTALREDYGIDTDRLTIVTFYSDRTRADNLRIALMAARRLRWGKAAGAILSRNLYASFLLGVLARRPMLFETHQLELGVRKPLQRAIMTRPWVTTVVISRLLQSCLHEHHGVAAAKTLVLHDSAPEGVIPFPEGERRAALAELVTPAQGPWDAVCGYFGHLYAGRGIEIIEAMAAERPKVLFLVYGGNDTDCNARRAANRLPNLHYMGYVPHATVRRIMTVVDILLMPYQESVGIGAKGHDTARWMSPMKMFEYMGTGLPIISSDLPALREVLTDGENALLVPAAAPAAWIAALDRLVGDPVLARGLGATAHRAYAEEYTWTERGRRILAAAEAL